MKSRLVELDYMRGLACIAVILTHITALGVVEYLPGSPHKILSTYMNRSFNFTVPVFIFLSGLTGFLGYTKKPFHYGVFLKKRLGKIVIPYILWVFFYYASFLAMGIYVLDIQYLMKSIILGDMSYHLYFIVIIVQLYLLSPLFYYVVKRWNNKYFIGAMGLLNLYFMVTVYFPYSDRIFFKYMFFYILGISAALNYDLFIDRIKKIWSSLHDSGYFGQHSLCPDLLSLHGEQHLLLFYLLCAGYLLFMLDRHAFKRKIQETG